MVLLRTPPSTRQVAHEVKAAHSPGAANTYLDHICLDDTPDISYPGLQTSSCPHLVPEREEKLGGSQADWLREPLWASVADAKHPRTVTSGLCGSG